MEIYTIFIANDGIKCGFRDPLRGYCDTVLQECDVSTKASISVPQPLPPVVSPLHVALVAPESQQEQICWTEISLENVAGQVERVLAQAGVGQEAINESCNVLGSERIAESLEILAKSIPKSRVYTEIMWLAGEEDFPDISGNLSLFGVLKQLVDDNSARISLISSQSLGANAEPWVQTLRAQLVPPEELSRNLQGLMWRGNIVMQESQFAKPVILEGFMLQYKTPRPLAIRVRSAECNQVPAAPLLPACNMHFITKVTWSSIPSFYLTHHTYKLNVTSSSKHLAPSKAFLKSLKDQDPGTCYIVRLCMSSGSQNPEMEESGQPTRNISKNTDNKATQGESFHFLLAPSGDETSCDAFLMRPISQLNGAIGSRLVELELTTPTTPADNPEGYEDAANLIEGLPHFSVAQFTNILHAVDEVQAAVLRNWAERRQTAGDSVEVRLEDLLAILKSVRTEVLECLETSSCPRPPRVVGSALQATLIDEYDQCMYTSLERAVLVARAEHQKSLERSQSNENIGGLAPPQGQVLKLDVGEFLKHFKPDGTAISEQLQTIQLKSPDSLLCKYTSERIQEWIEGTQEKQHGTYYNIGDQMDKVEKRCDKMKARLQYVETCSTCSYVQAGAAAAITLPVPKDNEAKHKKPTRASKRLSPAPPSTSGRKRERRSPLQEKASTNGGNKPASKQTDKSLVDESKRMLASHKQQKAINQQKANGKKAMSESERQARLARSQRHKKKLEEVVRLSLESKGVSKDDDIFKACAQRLYTLVKCFVKDLATSHNLRQEMTKLAELHVGQVIDFERTRSNKRS